MLKYPFYLFKKIFFQVLLLIFTWFVAKLKILPSFVGDFILLDLTDCSKQSRTLGNP